MKKWGNVFSFIKSCRSIVPPCVSSLSAPLEITFRNSWFFERGATFYNICVSSILYSLCHSTKITNESSVLQRVHCGSFLTKWSLFPLRWSWTCLRQKHICLRSRNQPWCFLWRNFFSRRTYTSVVFVCLLEKKIQKFLKEINLVISYLQINARSADARWRSLRLSVENSGKRCKAA